MHGVIAAGSDATAEAGIEILAQGGNAADAAVAACFATAVGEPTLTSLAGGGVMIYRQADTGKVQVCDFFSDAPRLRGDQVDAFDFYGVDLDFGPTTQRFYIGAGSAAVPGVLPGLCEVIDAWGSMSLKEVIQPACRMMRDGTVLGPYQGRAAKLLEPILTHTDSARSIFAPNGKMIAGGDRFRLPQLADTLEAMATNGWREHYDHVLVPAMLKQFGPDAGGVLTHSDFDDYRVVFREPLSMRYRNTTMLTNPPPAAGGFMIAMMLKLLESAELSNYPQGSTEQARLLSCLMAVSDEARCEGLPGLNDAQFDRWRDRFEELHTGDVLSAPPSRRAPASTTHVSVLDEQGNAASITFSYGEGNAHIIGDSGIMMNNLMGEEDLFPDGFGSAPTATRLPTMMSPTLLLDDDGAITVMGTGGANRIRTAIVQVVSLLTDYGLTPETAIGAPRVHYEDGVLNAEIFDNDDGAPGLDTIGAPKVVRFEEPNLFFGGVHLVRRNADGHLEGAGDPRRGGCFRKS